MEDIAVLWRKGGTTPVLAEIQEDDLHDRVHGPTLAWMHRDMINQGRAISSLPESIRQAAACASLEFKRLELDSKGVEIDIEDNDVQEELNSYFVLVALGAAMYRDAIEGRLVFNGE